MLMPRSGSRRDAAAICPMIDNFSRVDTICSRSFIRVMSSGRRARSSRNSICPAWQYTTRVAWRRSLVHVEPQLSGLPAGVGLLDRLAQPLESLHCPRGRPIRVRTVTVRDTRPKRRSRAGFRKDTALPRRSGCRRGVSPPATIGPRSPGAPPSPGAARAPRRRRQPPIELRDELMRMKNAFAGRRTRGTRASFHRCAAV